DPAQRLRHVLEDVDLVLAPVTLGHDQPVADVDGGSPRDALHHRRRVRVEDPGVEHLFLRMRTANAQAGLLGETRLGTVGHAGLREGWDQISKAGVPNVWSSASLRDTR